MHFHHKNFSLPQVFPMSSSFRVPCETVRGKIANDSCTTFSPRLPPDNWHVSLFYVLCKSSRAQPIQTEWKHLCRNILMSCAWRFSTLKHFHRLRGNCARSENYCRLVQMLMSFGILPLFIAMREKSICRKMFPGQMFVLQSTSCLAFFLFSGLFITCRNNLSAYLIYRLRLFRRGGRWKKTVLIENSIFPASILQ